MQLLNKNKLRPIRLFKYPKAKLKCRFKKTHFSFDEIASTLPACDEKTMIENTQMSAAACSIRLDKLQQLAPSLLPVLSREPVAVCVEDQPCFYLVGPQLFEALLAGQKLPDLAVPAPLDKIMQSEPTFAQVAERLLAQEAQRVARGAFTEASLNIMRNRLKRHILPVLGARAVRSCDTKAMEEMVARLTQDRVSSITLSQYLVIVRKVLKLAMSRKWLHEMPEIPSIQIDNKPRSALTVDQYQRLLRCSKRLMREGVEAPSIKMGEGTRERFWITPRYRTLPIDMYWLIIFMVNSFVRPSDIKILKHGHVEVVRGQHDYLRLTMPATKKHDKPIVTLRPAVRVYEALFARAQAQGHADANDYVFLPQEKNREHALALFNFWLKWVLRQAGLTLTDSHGQARTLYSLRHTSITFRLLYGQGIDMLTLARNARTSVNMIERFYASTLTGEMNVAMLQSRREQKKTPSLAARG